MVYAAGLKSASFVGSNPTTPTKKDRTMRYYRQCTFKQGNTFTTAWVEERVKVGCKVTFKDRENSGFWEVLSVGDHRITEAAAKKFERAYLKQREASDI